MPEIKNQPPTSPAVDSAGRVRTGMGKPSTQLYLDIAEIKNDIVVLKDGSLRAVLMVSSVNFALKSEDEQNALVSSYVSFMNYLDFPIQIVVQSRKLDISGYMKRLTDAERDLTNELLRRQIVNYRSYVQELIDLGDIMTKRFFIVVPFSPIEEKSRGFWSRLGGVFTPSKVIQLKQEKFDEYARSLNQRIEHVKMNISGLGLTTVRLETQSLIELYYETYNPSTASTEKLVDLDKLRVED